MPLFDLHKQTISIGYFNIVILTACHWVGVPAESGKTMYGTQINQNVGFVLETDFSVFVILFYFLGDQGFNLPAPPWEPLPL